jgi:hypothetical protein
MIYQGASSAGPFDEPTGDESELDDLRDSLADSLQAGV